MCLVIFCWLVHCIVADICQTMRSYVLLETGLLLLVVQRVLAVLFLGQDGHCCMFC